MTLPRSAFRDFRLDSLIQAVRRSVLCRKFNVFGVPSFIIIATDIHYRSPEVGETAEKPGNAALASHIMTELGYSAAEISVAGPDQS